MAKNKIKNSVGRPVIIEPMYIYAITAIIILIVAAII